MSDPRLWIFLSNNKNCIITAYSDSDWAACPDTRRSVSGYIVLMGDNIICWKSKKQTTISLSSAEAEYRAVRNVVGELVWLEILMTELHGQLQKGLIQLHHKPTEEQLADVLTKSLPSSKQSIILYKLAVNYSPPT
ncbi:uncharacterized mitochondrial protein AtMg00810-like [Solanum lycopersicum]|uniref:uncharacterized mitochondrial protein AtMg00810-like n=1 Tax=Solanum lycopersicum TaxID=4081 RepID=UPI0037490BA9